MRLLPAKNISIHLEAAGLKLVHLTAELIRVAGLHWKAAT
ncbi:MAG: hypothetical protein N838_03235 [Thiohalocapsa sp. PB-PSB1]|nr:MAG: hypothetical protein N838_03235 [Thiohalocapsa sp. PB-PSB1]